MILKNFKESNGTSIVIWRKLFPFLRWWNFIGWDTLRADLIAGLTGAIIVLPQGVAFAMIAGLPPEYGLYTAIVTPIVAALFGSSLHLISGPTTAISIVIFSSISPFADAGSAEFIRLTLSLTFMAGIYQLAFGLARMGTLVNFVSHSVVLGFTAGASILIMTSQLKHVLGMNVPRGASFVNTWINILSAIENVNLYVLFVALIAFVCAFLFKIYRPRWPGLLFAMGIGSLASLLMAGESHGVLLMGELPRHLPPFSVPDYSFSTLRQLAPAGMAIALLGLIEALSIARSISIHSQQSIDGNQEFIGQGLSNIIGCFFSSYAGSGSFTRSAINYHAGAMTPLSAVFSSIFLALILLLVAPLTAYLPIPAMGGIIVLVAYNLIDFQHIRKIFKASRQEIAVILTTFLATLFLELQFAILAGFLLSLILYMIRTSHPRFVKLAPKPDTSELRLIRAQEECPQFKIVRIDGSLFFGAVQNVQNFLREIDKKSTYKQHILIIASGINFIDMAGAEMLSNESQRRRKLRGGLYLCGLKQEVREFLQRGRYIDVIGNDHIFTSKREAIAKICSGLDTSECRHCQKSIFQECKGGLDSENQQ
jgi:sulfate permease, SulP family